MKTTNIYNLVIGYIQSGGSNTSDGKQLLFSFLKATKCIAFYFSRLDVPSVSIVSQLSYGSSRLRSAKTPFRDWSVSRNHIADPRSYNIQRQQTILKV